MITTPGSPPSAACANAAENSVPSAEVRVSRSAAAPPAIRRRARSFGSSGGRESKSKHITDLLPGESPDLRRFCRGRAGVRGEFVADRLAGGLGLEHDEL